jgi:putative Holliday junction resolvase
MRKIGLDIGEKRIGIAVSDLMGIIANPRESYVRQGGKSDVEYFVNLVKAEEADTVVVGIPYNMDGSDGKNVAAYRAFGEKIGAAAGVKVEYIDERLTTAAAEKMLIEGNVRRDKRKLVIDKVAACIILQTYLDKIKY